MLPNLSSNKGPGVDPILPLEENPNFDLFQDLQKQKYFEETALRTFQIFVVVNCLSSTAYFLSHFL